MMEKLCECNCGQVTNIHQGKPRRYIWGHHRRGLPSGNYKGPTLINTAGYRQVLVTEDHPYFEMSQGTAGGSKYILEHRLVMAEWINRALRSSEVVHHENEIRSDNRIENLRLFHTSSSHIQYHAKKRRSP